MAEIPWPRMCLEIPIDHRLEPLLGARLATPGGPGRHTREIEKYGQRLQKDGEYISDKEVKFAKWLAKPDTKGGVVIVLLQPAEHQRYFSDHQQTVKDCDTLDAVDEVCKAVTGRGLEKISCFDVFPFHKTPVGKSDEDELDKAYAIFLRMIQQKQPDVVFCCYRSPHPTKYRDFQCNGIRHTGEYEVSFQGKHYTCVCGFHPSSALNYLEDKSALRTTFIVQATQAFRRANGTWRASSWMIEVRKDYATIIKNDIRDKENEPNWTKHDFQRERFQLYMELIMSIWDALTSGSYHEMTNDELYHLFLEKRYNSLFSDCLLLLVKIINFEDHGGARLEEKGFAGLRQREERDVRDLKRNVEKRCDEFLRSLRRAGAPFQVERRGKGLFTSAGLRESLVPLGLFSNQSGFHYNLRRGFLILVHTLNSAYTYNGRGVYNIDKYELAHAFTLAASHLERAMAQHVASIQRRVPEEELEISSQLNRLKVNSSPQQTKNATHPRISHTKKAPIPSSASLQSPAVTPQRRSTSSSQYRPTFTCTGCKKNGHSVKNCPKTQCRICKDFGHMSFDCPGNPSTPQRWR